MPSAGFVHLRLVAIALAAIPRAASAAGTLAAPGDPMYRVDGNPVTGSGVTAPAPVNGSVTAPPTVPVVLVHGWRGAPNLWDELRADLSADGYTEATIWVFDYEELNRQDPRMIAVRFHEFIGAQRARYSYRGPIDVVCHSMGALVTRQYMEVDHRDAAVRSWIGLAPVNHGAAFADLARTPPVSWLVGLLSLATGGVVPGPGEPAVEQLATTSPTVTGLERAGTRADVTYRVIVGYNSEHRWDYGGILGRTPGYDLDQGTAPGMVLT
ncbi:MAG: alpha/beta fold hydrolase [Methanospirillum sp.]|nr:alpha/beta fold hydrolase [Methanospirillum sp.]